MISRVRPQVSGQALALRPDEAVFHYNLANVLRDAGQLDAAIASYRAALALRPQFDADTLLNLGNALVAHGEPGGRSTATGRCCGTRRAMEAGLLPYAALLHPWRAEVRVEAVVKEASSLDKRRGSFPATTP